MKIRVPTIGERLRLVEPWEFKLYHEYRNREMWDMVGAPEPDDDRRWDDDLNVPSQLPAGAVLTIGRVYIRGTAKRDRDFDSFTFVLTKRDNPWLVSLFNERGLKRRDLRFWVKLHDVNQISAVILPPFNKDEL